MPWVYIWTKDKIDGPIFVRGGGGGGGYIRGGIYSGGKTLQFAIC